MPRLTFWFEFASTYSYLSAARIGSMAEAAGLEVEWRPFLLGPIFREQGWQTSPFNVYEAKGRNMWRDMERQAQKYGLPPLTQPKEFPQNSLLAARLATCGAGEPWGPEFVRSVYTAQFAEGLDIADSAVLAARLDALGLDGGALIEQVKSDQTIKDRLRANTEQAVAMGIYGAPSFTTDDGEVFWGNDRLEDALEWANSPKALGNSAS